MGNERSTGGVIRETGGASAAALAAALTGSYMPLLTRTSVKVAAYNAAANDLVVCDISGGSFTVTLPTAPADKTLIGIKLITTLLGGSLTVARGGADVFNKAGGSTSLAIARVNQSLLLQYDSATAIWTVIVSDDALASDIQVFLTSGTWTKPVNAKRVDVWCVGGGGGGGSGRKGLTTTVRCGGGGGGGAAVSYGSFSASDLATVAVTVGAVGTGGPAQATISSDGSPGIGGGTTFFGAASGSAFVRASGGNFGAAGTAAAGAGGISAVGMLNSCPGGAASTSGSTGNAGVGATGSAVGAAGGGAGGGVTNGDSPSTGGAGGRSGMNVGQTAPSGGNGGGANAGGPGVNLATASFQLGTGGGGGGGSINSNGGDGGAGSMGSGGGGGGAAQDLQGNSGKGGDGGSGMVIVMTSY